MGFFCTLSAFTFHEEPKYLHHWFPPVHFVRFLELNTADKAFTQSVVKIDRVNKVNKNAHIHTQKHTHTHIQYMVIDLVVLSGL